MNDTLGSTSPDIRTVDSGRGLAWWTEAWALFTPSAILWIALGLIMLAGYAVVGMVPVVGGLVLALATPVFVGSWMLAARKVQGGGALAVGDLFTCFTGDRLTPLVVLGALLVAATLVIGVVAGALGMGLLISIQTKTQLLANQLAMVLTFLPAFLLSGFAFPITNMPKLIQLVTYLVPARYFITLLKGIYLKGIGLHVLFLEAVLLTVFGTVILAVAQWKFKKKLE